MKRKLSLNHPPAPVRIVRPRIEVLDSYDETTSATSVSATSSASHSTVTPVTITTSAVAANEVDVETDATSVSESDGTDEDACDSLSESSSDSDSSEESDVSESDEDCVGALQNEPHAHKVMSDLAAARNEVSIASVYQDSATGMTTVRMGSKPVIDASLLPSSGGIVKRLKQLLPELQESNKVLDIETLDGTIVKRLIGVRDEDEDESSDEDEDEGGAVKPYIEMNLGLGVLEQTDMNGASTIESKVAERLFGQQPTPLPDGAIFDVHDEAMQ